MVVENWMQAGRYASLCYQCVDYFDLPKSESHIMIRKGGSLDCSPLLFRYSRFGKVAASVFRLYSLTVTILAA